MLNDQQLQYLESYCVMNGVKYYDLQLEVIDHVAAMIEDIQQDNPSVDFKDALNLANARFKKSDFRMMVKNKKHQLQKKVSRLIEKEFLSFFTLPRIILTGLMYVLACSIPVTMRSNEQAGIIGIVLLSSPFFYCLIRYRQQIRLIQYDREINLLCLKIRSRYEIIVGVCLASLNLILNGVRVFFNIHLGKSDYMTLFIVLFLVTLELLYIAILHVRFAFNGKMRMEYPNAFLNARGLI